MLERIKTDLLAAVNVANKRDLKTLRSNFDALDKDVVKNAMSLFNVKCESDVDKELLLFYIKGKPVLRLKVSFETFDNYHKFLRSYK